MEQLPVLVSDNLPEEEEEEEEEYQAEEGDEEQETEEEDEEEEDYVIHDHCEAGRSRALAACLEDLDAEAQLQGDPNKVANAVCETDEDGCAPLHLALLGGHVDCIKMLLQASSKVKKLEGSPPLHIAACLSGHCNRQQQALLAAIALLAYGADPFMRDDQKRTALHWAAVHGQEAMAQLLLNAAAKMPAAAPPASENESPPKGPGLLVLKKDNQGNTALHLAACSGHAGMVKMLLAPQAPWGVPAERLAGKRNLQDQLPLHLAALGTCLGCIHALLDVLPESAGAADGCGRTPVSLAAQRGYLHMGQHGGAADALRSAMALQPRMPQTVIIAPQDCHNHLTCAEPITRQGEEPPPENVRRLRVLTNLDNGTLRSDDFDDVKWETECRRAAMADVLRVHDWAYVRKLMQTCSGLADSPDAIGLLDSDTSLSRGTFGAACSAAGAVCRGVDAVMSGQARNAFCAVRPPGHHAGPSGVVTSEQDSEGSHGFCLLNNIAIGAAYAMNVYRHAGVKRVAILDFDVHHGNGTQACVAACRPHTMTFEVKTPFSSGSQSFPVYKPWLDEDDGDNIFFASVQGYGAKGESEGYLYPGSGATVDSRMPFVVKTGDAYDADAVMANGTAPHVGETEDDKEFCSAGLETAPSKDGPHIINVGIAGPEPVKWRRAWRDKILPALAAFRPDLILVSAGFDAHKKDILNHNFIGVQEEDYEWVTDQIVQVANLCCDGRVVSALEGGYRVQGGLVSAFGRSVAAHVTALKRPHRQVWDAADAGLERRKEREERLRKELERRASPPANVAAPALSAATNGMGTLADEAAPTAIIQGVAEKILQQAVQAGGGEGTVTVQTSIQTSAGSSMPDRKRRRRGQPVDYVNLNIQMDQEKRGPA